jgi:hypothetical protein
VLAFLAIWNASDPPKPPTPAEKQALQVGIVGLHACLKAKPRGAQEFADCLKNAPASSPTPAEAKAAGADLMACIKAKTRGLAEFEHCLETRPSPAPDNR